VNPSEHVASTLRPSKYDQFLHGIVRLRWWLFGIAAVFLLVSFNGRWRIGRDSAAYRGLGHQLATTGKYQFRDKNGLLRYTDQQDIRYPGLPILLAGVERFFGRSDFAAVSSIFILGAMAVWLTYLLARPAFPVWLAVAVTFGLGTNGRFLRHVHAILSDVPFLCGVVLTLLSFDRLARAPSGRARVVWMFWLVVGLVFSASMRPTFWVLALALVVTCLWGLIGRTHQGQEDSRSRRLACAMTLALVVGAAAIFVRAVDLRGKGVANGGYEAKVLSRLTQFERQILTQLPANAHEMFEQTLPESFFGTQFGGGFVPVGGGRHIGFGTVMSLLVIASAVWLARRNLAWGLFALGSIVTMCGLGSVPRYVIMILPLLLAGWGLFVAGLARRLAARGLAEVVLIMGFGVVIGPNIIQCVDFVREQRGLTRSFKYVGFDRAYNSGSWAAARPVADMIQQHVSPQHRVIGPEATVLTYLSDRDVYALGKLLPKRDKASWVPRIRKLGFEYAVFPDEQDGPARGKNRITGLYDDKDKITGRLILAGVLRPTTVIARAGGYRLCQYEVVAAKKVGRQRKGAATRPAATQPATAPVGGKKSARNRRLAAAAAAASTRPSATKPAATQPTGRRRTRAAATNATTLPGVVARAGGTAGSTQAAATQPTRRRRVRATTGPGAMQPAATQPAPKSPRLRATLMPAAPVPGNAQGFLDSDGVTGMVAPRDAARERG
jgi:hypothetical protein